MLNNQLTERSTTAGLYAEIGKAGSQLKDQLAATLAHELRNPLASILIDLHAMSHSRVDEVIARQARDSAERQAWHMAQIIEDVLDICSGGQGKLSLRKERVDLAAVVAGAVKTAGPFLTTRGHHLTVSLPQEPVSLVADSSRLNQILTNLLANAAKYTDHGGEICLAAGVADGGVVLRVRDNGMGIAPDLLPRIFDLFQQGNRPGNRACSGLGIGLALVKSLVELHGGSVEAFSHGPGTGSEFVVSLPDCAPIIGEAPVEEAPVPGVLATVVPLAAIGGPWFRPVEGGDWQALLATAVVALIALLGIVWLSRARATRRWKAILDAYAAREIARDRRRKAPPLEPRAT
jgi:signal transduction histidine kinase